MAYKVEVGNLSEMITKVGFAPWVYDTDGDCYISLSESNVAVHDCYMGVITEAQRDEVVALWQNGTRNPACPPLIWEWIKAHWKWIAGGVGAVIVISSAVALAKRR